MQLSLVGGKNDVKACYTSDLSHAQLVQSQLSCIKFQTGMKLWRYQGEKITLKWHGS